MYWYKEVSAYLEDYIPSGSFPIVQTLPSLTDSEEAVPLSFPGQELQQQLLQQKVSGGLYSLNKRRGELLHWRLLEKKTYLEVRLLQSYTPPQTSLTDTSSNSNGISSEVSNPLYNIPIRFELKSPIISSVSIFEEPVTGAIHICFLTSSSVFYRLVFKPGTFFRDSRNFTCKLKKIESIGGSKAPIIVSAADLDTFIIGCSNGNIVVITCPINYQHLENDEG